MTILRQLRVLVAAATLLGALGVAAQAAAETAQQCYATLNQYRTKAGLAKASSTSIPALTQLGFTGINPWDRTKAAKLADGTWRYQYEDVTTATGIASSALEGVRSWVDAPYHRFPLLDANTRHVGCAATERQVAGRRYAAEALNMAATWKDTTKRITVYPASGQTGVPTSFHRCQEHPTPSAAPATRPTRRSPSFALPMACQVTAARRPGPGRTAAG